MECIFLIQPPLKDNYPETPQTVQNFLKFLEVQGSVNVKLINHTVSRIAKDTQVEYTIEPQTPSVFEIQQKFNSRNKPSRETGCALIDMAKAKTSQHVRFIQSFTCPQRVRLCLADTSHYQPPYAPMRK